MAPAARLLALSACSCGLQIVWSILLSSGTPFLTSVGFNGSSTALVWSIAPICGAFVQPWFGALSDRHQWRQQERRVLLLMGAIATCVSLLCFSLSRAQVTWFLRLFDYQPTGSTEQILNQVTSVTWFLCLNIALQPLQMASRVIIIENNDSSDQVIANAWVGRMQGIGSILGFLLGSIPLRTISPPGLINDFVLLCFFGSVLVLSTSLISALAIKDRSNFTSQPKTLYDLSIESRLKSLLAQISTVPKELWQIFVVQFLAWLGWFPFRTYYTSWLAYSYPDTVYYEPATANVEFSAEEHAAHLGSLAGLSLSIVSFVANCFLPLAADYLDHALNSKGSTHPRWKRPNVSTSAMLYVWLGSHVYFAFAIFALGWASSQTGQILVISSLGFSWAVTLWVPFSLVGVITSRQQERFLNGGTDHRQPQMGAVVGLHNAAVSAPQILSASICSVALAASSEATKGTLAVLLSGGCWSVVAAFALWLFIPSLQCL